MFKIKVKKKPHCVRLDSIVEIYNTHDNVWESYIVTSIVTSIDGESLICGMRFGLLSGTEISLFRESRFHAHIEQNLLRIKRL